MEESESVFSMTPMSRKLMLEPGEVYEGTITIFNPMSSKENFSYKVGVTPYNVVGSDYAADLSTQTERSRIVDWIKIAEPLGTVAPNESKDIHYTITVPEDAPGGGQYAAITVGSDERDSSGSEGVNIKNIYEMASILYAKVNGEIVRGGEVQENKVPGFVTALPIKMSLTLTNDGNVHETAKVKLVVKNFLNGVQLYPEDGSEGVVEEVMMPETNRIIERNVESVSPLGLYEVTQSVEYLGKTSSVTQLVVACPIWFMVMLLVVIVVIAYGIVRLVKKRRRDSADAMM